jgi:hypothetical protein
MFVLSLVGSGVIALIELSDKGFDAVQGNCEGEPRGGNILATLLRIHALGSSASEGITIWKTESAHHRWTILCQIW